MITLAFSNSDQCRMYGIDGDWLRAIAGNWAHRHSNGITPLLTEKEETLGWVDYVFTTEIKPVVRLHACVTLRPEIKIIEGYYPEFQKFNDDGWWLHCVRVSAHEIEAALRLCHCGVPLIKGSHVDCGEILVSKLTPLGDPISDIEFR